ncbi:unnamed protein product [Amoebophrya sp. A120]|nr:unnamed protein product [Amoebophrya sp. A120]|eukprot:GSA120T00015283001.1
MAFWAWFSNLRDAMEFEQEELQRALAKRPLSARRNGLAPAANPEEERWDRKINRLAVFLDEIFAPVGWTADESETSAATTSAGRLQGYDELVQRRRCVRGLSQWHGSQFWLGLPLLHHNFHVAYVDFDTYLLRPPAAALRAKADALGVDLLVGGSILDDCINNGFWWMRPTLVMKRWFLKFAAYVYRHPEGCHQKLMSAMLGDNLAYQRRAERWTLPYVGKKKLFQFYRYFNDDALTERKSESSAEQRLQVMEEKIAQDVAEDGSAVIPRWAPLDPRTLWGHAFHYDEEAPDGESTLLAFHFEAGGWVENKETVQMNDRFREQLLSGNAEHRDQLGETRTDEAAVASGAEFSFFYGPEGPPSPVRIRHFLRSRRLQSLPKKLKVCNQSGRYAFREEDAEQESDSATRGDPAISVT